MKVQNNYSNYFYVPNFMPVSKNFGSAEDIDLDYILKNRMYLLPKRMQEAVINEVKKGNSGNISGTGLFPILNLVLVC